MKIGQYLAKIWTRVVSPFFDSRCVRVIVAMKILILCCPSLLCTLHYIGGCGGLRQMFDFIRRQTVFQYPHGTINSSSAFGGTPTYRAVTAGSQATKTATKPAPSASSSDATTPRRDCRRRRRVLFSREQTIALEEWFGRHRYVSAADRDRLAASLALRPTQVKIWFQNRRYKLKKIRRQMERNRDRMMTSSADISSTATATSLHRSPGEFSCHPGGGSSDRPTVGQTAVVRRIAVPVLVRDGRPCWSRTYNPPFIRSAILNDQPRSQS